MQHVPSGWWETFPDDIQRSWNTISRIRTRYVLTDNWHVCAIYFLWHKLNIACSLFILFHIFLFVIPLLSAMPKQFSFSKFNFCDLISILRLILITYLSHFLILYPLLFVDLYLSLHLSFSPWLEEAREEKTKHEF